MVSLAQQFRHLLLFKVNAESFQFLCLPFGLCTAPRVFTKVLKPAIELLRTLGIRLVIYMDDMLLMASSVQLIHARAHIHSTLSPGESGVCHQQPKVHTNPLSANRIPWNDCEFAVHGAKTSRREIKEDQNRSSAPSGHPKCPSSITSSAPRQAECNQSSSPNGTAVLSLTTDVSHTDPISQLSGLPVNNHTIPTGNRGPGMVGTPPHLLEWEKPDLPSLHDNNRLRCFTAGLGSNL